MYAKATIEVIFEHGEGASYGKAAEVLAAFLASTAGSVFVARVADVAPLNEQEVVTSLGGCGECEQCQAAVSLLADSTAATASEEAAIDRARFYA